MFYGEHLCAEEVTIKCDCGCGIAAAVQVVDKLGQSCGWFTTSCAYKKRKELRRYETIAKAIVRKGRL